MRIVQLVIFSLGLLMMSQTDTSAQSGDTNAVSQSAFDTLSKELIYDTKRALVPRHKKAKEAPKKKNPEIEIPSSGLGLGGGGFVQAIGYILIAGLAVFILYFLISGIKIKPHIDTKEIELSQVENIEEIDAVSGYDEALKNGDYRLALRMQFIKVLQVLSTNDLILWKPDKTNRQYLNETRGEEIHATFRSLSQTYEWVWYGNSAIGKETFDQLNVQFESFNKLDKVI